jgi:hypothetical protein
VADAPAASVKISDHLVVTGTNRRFTIDKVFACRAAGAGED